VSDWHPRQSEGALSGDLLGLCRLAQFSDRLIIKAPAPTRHPSQTATSLTGARPIPPLNLMRLHQCPASKPKFVTPPMLKRMLRHVSRSSFPARDRAMILLSIKAGLRACEIAGLDWSMVLDAQGRVSGTIHVVISSPRSAGGGGFACIPICGGRWSSWRALRSQSVP
jgi:integrase